MFQVEITEGKRRGKFLTAGSPQPEFDKVLTNAGVPLPAKGKRSAMAVVPGGFAGPRPARPSHPQLGVQRGVRKTVVMSRPGRRSIASLRLRRDRGDGPEPEGDGLGAGSGWPSTRSPR